MVLRMGGRGWSGRDTRDRNDLVTTTRVKLYNIGHGAEAGAAGTAKTARLAYQHRPELDRPHQIQMSENNPTELPTRVFYVQPFTEGNTCPFILKVPVPDLFKRYFIFRSFSEGLCTISNIKHR